MPDVPSLYQKEYTTDQLREYTTGQGKRPGQLRIALYAGMAFSFYIGLIFCNALLTESLNDGIESLAPLAPLLVVDDDDDDIVLENTILNSLKSSVPQLKDNNLEFFDVAA